MKLRIKKSRISGIFLLLLMLSSTVAYGALRVIPKIESEEEIEIPSQNIIDYKLTSEQRRYLLRRGKTIVELEYSFECKECMDVKAKLESAAREFSDQMLLIELLTTGNKSLPIVRVESSFGRESLNQPTDVEIMDAFCDLFVNPPLRCATRNV